MPSLTTTGKGLQGYGGKEGCGGEWIPWILRRGTIVRESGQHNNGGGGITFRG